jgi:hypothetical protein
LSKEANLGAPALTAYVDAITCCNDPIAAPSVQVEERLIAANACNTAETCVSGNENVFAHAQRTLEACDDANTTETFRIDRLNNHDSA